MNFSSDPIHTLENLIAKNKSKSISIYLVLVLTLVLVLGLLPVVKINISRQSRGIVRSTTDNVPVISLVNGKITHLVFRNNSVVHRGDTLVKIARENLETEKATTAAVSTDVVKLVNDLNVVTSGNEKMLKTPAIQEEWGRYSAQKNEMEAKLAHAKITFDRYEKLFKKGVITKAEHEKYNLEYTTAKLALESLIKNQMAQWQNRKRELEEQQKNLKGTLNKIKIETKNYAILAPLSGTIENFSGLQAGSFLNASQSIATISPTDKLIVETTVSPNDIGFVRKNQEVKFQMDAFNYNQWGLLQGKVTEIDKNITIHENQAFFKVRCCIDSPILQLKNGYKTQITKGMTLTTRFMITRRSLFDLLFDKMDDWLNPKLLSDK